MELPLGWEFEEAVFSQSRERGAGGGAGLPYSAKRCEPRVRSRGGVGREAGAAGPGPRELVGATRHAAAVGLQMLCTGLFVLQWFCGETSGEEDAEVLTAQKFRADLAYREREFEVFSWLLCAGALVSGRGWSVTSGPVVLVCLVNIYVSEQP